MEKAGWSSILVAAMLFAFAVLADAQQPAKAPRIGYLGNTASGQAGAVGMKTFVNVCVSSATSRDKTSQSSRVFGRGKLSDCPISLLS